MLQEYNKDELVKWYGEHRNPADRIINDLARQAYEGVMHVYAYTAKLVGLDHIVSQQDFPTVFSNNYTRVRDTLSGIQALLLHEWNIRLGKDTLEHALAYWLFCGNMYEVLVAKIITKYEDTRDKEIKHTLKELANRLASSSILNGIKTKKDWTYILPVEETKSDTNLEGKEKTHQSDANVEADIEHDVPQIPPELNTKRGLLVLQKAIENGLCDEHYHWLKTKALLAYFSKMASIILDLSQSVQDGFDKISWKPFEQLFGYKDLRYTKNYFQNKTGKPPKGHKVIENLFKKLPLSDEWQKDK